MTSDTHRNYNLSDKLYDLARIQNDYSLSRPISKIRLEIGFIDLLQSLLDYGNTYMLESFTVRLEMEYAELEKRG
jgi:hypothetical protein